MSDISRINGSWKPPSYLPTAEITDREAGIPYVKSAGKEAAWDGMPGDSKLSCQFKAKGILWFPRKGLVPKLFAALKDPANHPRLLSGVEAAKAMHQLEDADPVVLHHVYSLQAGIDFQYLSDVVAHDVRYGVIFEQKKMENISDWVAHEDLFPEKRTDTLKSYEGRIELLEIANGTVIVMEFSALISNIKAPDCDFAAGSTAVSGLIPGFIGGDRAVRLQMEARLKNLYRFALQNQR